jgi:predicted DNA-binding transcriptional regulator AlpA
MKSKTRTLIKLDAVLDRIPISRVTVDRLEARGEFPKRRHIGRLVFWDATEIDQYVKGIGQEEEQRATS